MTNRRIYVNSLKCESMSCFVAVSFLEFKSMVIEQNYYRIWIIVWEHVNVFLCVLTLTTESYFSYSLRLSHLALKREAVGD
jgi:hypothetical protein